MVTSAGQEKYVITDGNGTIHYAECFMCALQLTNKYDLLNITTYCDWYGPNFTVTVISSQFGKEIAVSPPNALFLNGGSCVINRVAYNQTAADSLLANGYSQYTLAAQHYALPTSTKVSNVAQAAAAFNQNSNQSSKPLPFPLILGVAAGVSIIVLLVFAYYKIYYRKTLGEAK